MNQKQYDIMIQALKTCKYKEQLTKEQFKEQVRQGIANTVKNVTDSTIMQYITEAEQWIDDHWDVV